MKNAQEIKKWLKTSGLSREWLADHCGVSKTTVNGWLSSGRTIPRPAMLIIESLMGGQTIDPDLGLSEFTQFQELAAAEGKSINDKIAELMRAYVRESKGG